MKQNPLRRPTPAFGFEARDSNGVTLLMEAARRGELDKITECVEKRGADINAIDFEGNNALMHALDGGQDGAVGALLLNFGIDAAYVRPDGVSALTLAAAARNPEVIERLLQKNVALDGQQKETGNTALMLSALMGDGWAACMLVDAGADFETLKNARGQTARDLARLNFEGRDFACFEAAVTRRHEKAATQQQQRDAERRENIERAVNEATVLQRAVATLKPVALRPKPR